MPHVSLTVAVLALLGPAPAAQLNAPQDLLLRSVSGSPLTTGSSDSQDVALADVDADGDLEVLVARGGGQTNGLYWNNGAGQLTSAGFGPFVTDAHDSRSVTAADVDGDGDLDLLVANGPSAPNALYVNRGGLQGGPTGAFLKATTGPVVTDNANSRRGTFGDIDGDGDLDLFVANSSDDDNFLYVNQGGSQGGTPGEFVKVTTGPVVNDGGVSHEGCFGDIDGDGDLDLFVANHGGVVGGPGAVNFLYLNDGDGGFTRVVSGDVVTEPRHSLCAAFGDVDGDGDLDLFVGNNQAQDDQLFLNDGAGQFTAVTGVPPVDEGGETKSARFADVDVDGDLDLLLARRQGEPNRLFLNDGDGDFAPQLIGTWATDGADTHAVAAGDLDGDGRPDLVVVNRNSPNAIYRNAGAQWTDHGGALAGGPGEPVMRAIGNGLVGQALRLELSGARASAPAWFVVGLGAIGLPFKGGMFVPAPDLVVGFGTNASGAAVLGGPMPAGIPAELHLAFQIWVSDPDGPQGFAASNGLSFVTP